MGRWRGRQLLRAVILFFVLRFFGILPTLPQLIALSPDALPSPGSRSFSEAERKIMPLAG